MTIVQQAQEFVHEHYQNNIDKKYVFHAYQHVIDVLEAVRLLAESYELDLKEKLILELAAIFHDTGYNEGPCGHEERSVQLMYSFLQGKMVEEAVKDKIAACIMATKMPQNPADLLEAILCDADLNHLGNELYWNRCDLLRSEKALLNGNVKSDAEWVAAELEFLQTQAYHTEEAEALYRDQKEKHIRQLDKRRRRLIPEEAAVIIQQANKKKKKKKKKPQTDAKQLKAFSLGRGVETMFRSSYRTHVNLSSIADNKANIMLSINAIIISIVVSNLVPRFDEDTHLILPTLFLLVACLVALVFAILSTRPKVTEGKVTIEDIRQRKSNLLFFGNFHKMQLDDFHHGIMEMIKDSDFLYSSMTRDLYFLGIVLAKKYHYLRICYNVFMYGLIISVALFAISYSYTLAK